MKSILIEQICREFLPRYKSEGVNISLEELMVLANKEVLKAEKNYSRLTKPKANRLDNYIAIWVSMAVANDFARRTLKKISLNNPPPLFKAAARYYFHIPLELHIPLARELFKVKPEEREKVWESFALPFRKIEEKFIEMTFERIRFAKKKGYSTYIEMFLDKNKIPGSDLERFIKNRNKLIDYCNKNLPKIGALPSWFYSEFNLPCYMCRLPSFPFKSLDEVLNFVAKRYEILGKFRHKVNIELGEKSKVFYKKETDSFEVTIGKDGNTRHRVTDLVHELSHVINYLNNFEEGINPVHSGKYLSEKDALIIELSILQKLSQPWYRSTFCEALLSFRRLLFENELYSNPKRDLSKLYAETFNRCFKEAKQIKNRIYILDERINLEPFSALPHAIANSEVILGLIKSGN